MNPKVAKILAQVSELTKDEFLELKDALEKIYPHRRENIRTVSIILQGTQDERGVISWNIVQNELEKIEHEAQSPQHEHMGIVFFSYALGDISDRKKIETDPFYQFREIWGKKNNELAIVPEPHIVEISTGKIVGTKEIIGIEGGLFLCRLAGDINTPPPPPLPEPQKTQTKTKEAQKQKTQKK